MAERKKKPEGVGIWIAIALLFLLELWPIALVVLFFKLSGDDDKRRKELPPQAAPPKAETGGTAGRTKKAVRSAMKSPVEKKSTAKRLKIVGAVLAVVGLAASWEPIDMMIWLGEIDSWYVEDLLWALALAVAGGAMIWKGCSMDRQLRRYAKYLAVLGDREAMPVEELSRTLGYPERQVERDLQRMIEKGYFGGKAYLNVELGHLVRSGAAEQALRERQARERAERTPPPPEAEKGYSGILRNIRRANDRIADPILSAKIDRLEEITARIFRAVEEDPQKRPRIDTFLNYYLPTTQKLLDSYAEFEAAGVEGENLSQAKQRIENTMDAIVRGFEHQLDELYKADALDVDSDIRVMESMLRRDTASVEQDFGQPAKPPAGEN